MAIPAEVAVDIYDKSTWERSYTFMEDYVDENNPGTALNLLPYEIKWEGKQREFAKDTYFSYEKLEDDAGGDGITVSGTNNNVLTLALDTDDTNSFRGRVIISDVKFILDYEVMYTLRITLKNQAGVTE